MKKNKRQEKILELINQKQIANQRELMDELLKAGIKTTQATVSRDIKELQLVKVRGIGGETYFQITNNSPNSETNLIEPEYYNRIETIFKESVIDIVSNNFLIIIKTLPGMAQAAAHAIDTINLSDILGTIAGDDTIFVAVSKESDIGKLLNEFQLLIKKE